MYSYGDDQDGGIGAKSYPLDYIPAGDYRTEMGRLARQGTDGDYWSGAIYNSGNGFRTIVGSRIIPNVYINKVLATTFR